MYLPAIWLIPDQQKETDSSFSTVHGSNVMAILHDHVNFGSCIGKGWQSMGLPI